MALYVVTRCRVKVEEKPEDFGIGVEVHQESALSPLLVTVVMEEATEESRCDP